MEYDLTILGGGVAGYNGAVYAAKNGMKVALVENDKLGGTCLNRGCIPTKALLHAGHKIFDKESLLLQGLMYENLKVDLQKMYEYKDNLVLNLRQSIDNLIKSNKIDLFVGKGKIKSKNEVEVDSKILQTKNILICTGSSPIKLNIKGIENCLNSDDFLAHPIDEQNIVIIGGGVIGVEFASFLNYVGKDVTIIETTDRILPMFSKEISLQLNSILSKRGIKIITNALVNEITQTLEVKYIQNEQSFSVQGQKVICSVGRQANILDIGLQDNEIGFDKILKVDENFKTNIPNIYACGDCASKIQLAHFAEHSAIACINNILNKTQNKDLNLIPSCVYTFPEIAIVGKTEIDENTKSAKVVVGSNGKSIIEECPRGYVKVFANKQTNKIIGAELLCQNATELISNFTLAISNELTIRQFEKVVFAHPTISECLGQAIKELK